MRNYIFENIDQIVAEARSGSGDVPFRMLVLGSGMSGAIPDEVFRLKLPVSHSITAGHPMTGGIAELSGGMTLVLAGREHSYELDEPGQATELLDLFLAERPSCALFLSAAGGVSPLLRTGDLMLHSDYLSPVPFQRFRGHRSKPKIRRDSRRMDLGIDRLFERASEAGMLLRTGTYAWLSGPSYETRAEVRMLRRAGADAVGMSAYPEIVAAERFGVSTIGVSLITNELGDARGTPLHHSDVTDVSGGAEDRIRSLVACW